MPHFEHPTFGCFLDIKLYLQNVLMDSMWCDEREKLFKAAKSLAPSFKTFKARGQEIESRRKKDIKKRIEDNVRKELNTIKYKENTRKWWLVDKGRRTREWIGMLSTQRRRKRLLNYRLILEIKFSNRHISTKIYSNFLVTEDSSQLTNWNKICYF